MRPPTQGLAARGNDEVHLHRILRRIRVNTKMDAAHQKKLIGHLEAALQLLMFDGKPVGK